MLTSVLSWFIIVDSALLTDRFLQDMRRTHDDKGCTCAPEEWLPLYHPCPPPEVCQQFNQYVACRWPLRVFALDPVTDDQNVVDSYSMKRETQLALSLAFTTGQIGVGSFTRYARRIEKEIDTIALNRTSVGFSHGDHTFGWRFYPRVQTPPVPGNLQAALRDNLIGGFGPGYTLRRERLEPGMRECVALVIMPSFIPGVDLEVVGNWFRLAHPKCKALDLKDALKLSRTVRILQNRTAGACDHDKYRAGDGGTVLAKLDQVSQRLPLQHQQVDVPFENTHGGFELLSSGVTDLAPELLGWYGAPGIDPCGDTSIFLVGDNFSVHQTRVIVGGQMLDSSCPAMCTSGVCIPGSGGCAACAGAAGGAAAPSTAAPPTLVIPMLPAPGQTPPPAGLVPVLPLPGMVVPEPGVLEDGLGSVGSTGCVPVAGIAPAGFFSKHRPAAAPAATSNTAITVHPPALVTLPAVPTATPTVAVAAAPATPTVAATPAATPMTAVTTAGGGAATTATIAGTAPSAISTASPCVYQIELLSRQVMRVVIPKGVQSKDGMVDIHVATPYGVSPALSIPLRCEGSNCPAADKKAATPTVVVNPVSVAPAADAKPPTPDYTADGDIQVTYIFLDKKPVPIKVTGTVALGLSSKPSKTLPGLLKFSATFTAGVEKDFTVKATSLAVGSNGTSAIDKDEHLTTFATSLLAKLIPPIVSKEADPKAMPFILKSDSVQVELAAPNLTALPDKASGTIRVVLIYSPPAPAIAVPQPQMPAEGKK